MARSDRITFEGSRGRLAARLDRPPDRDPVAYALLAHCFGGPPDTSAPSVIAETLVAYGLGVLHLGLGGPRERTGADLDSSVEDVARAADRLREEHAAPALLVGHAFGGDAVLVAASRIDEARAVATIAAPCSPDEGAHLVEEALQGLGRPLAVFHAPGDEVVDVSDGERLFAAAAHPKTFVSLDTADHLLSDRADAVYVADVLAAWVTRYLAESMKDGAAEALPRGVVEVSEAGAGRYAQIVRAGRHVLAADEPPDAGDDSGPTPYDYVLAGLGACTSMTIRMYADRKDIPLEGVSVSLRHGHVHAEDCAECEEREGRIERIDRVISLRGDLSDEQRGKLLEIAGKCPVHRTLRSKPEIVTELA